MHVLCRPVNSNLKMTNRLICNVKIENLKVCRFCNRVCMENYKPPTFVCYQVEEKI